MSDEAHWRAAYDYEHGERIAAERELDRLRVEGSGLSSTTISTAIGLTNTALRAAKQELRESTDLARRKRLVARIEQLRAALAELDVVAMAAGALRRSGE